jgi:hypothetical protein
MPDVLLKATTNPDIVTVPARTVFSLDGQGAPEGEAFPRCIMAMYGVAYTCKFTRKKAGGRDFKIGPLEARWWTDTPERPFLDAPRETWRWQLRIAVPKDVNGAELSKTIDAVTQKRGGKLETNTEVTRVQLTALPEARYGRVLHVGPYATETESFRRIVAMLEAANVAPANAHLEVYLSDPRRTKPGKLKTVLLLELRGPR